jgi:ADP-dependent NAD(P)H-hydrate dehydratase
MKTIKSVFKQFDTKQAQLLLPTKRKTSNKTTAGKCLIFAGSDGMWGSALLCGEAAARMGSGYVYLYAPQKFSLLRNHPDFLFLKDFKNNDLKKFNAIAIGPGFKDHLLIKKLIVILKKSKFKNVVLDAEALNVLSKMKSFKPPKEWILTPHEGELSKLIHVSSKEIRKNRKLYSSRFQKQFQCTTLLKGYRTLIENDSQKIEILAGNAALAKAGTGDVLTGLIVALLCQGLAPLHAAALASFVHGATADKWIAEKNDPIAFKATDILKMLPRTLFAIRNGLS